MMNGLDRPDSAHLEGNVGACAHAHQLARMRVSVQTPTTPITPVGPCTPTFIPEVRFGEENVMEDLQLAAELGKTLLERNRELESNIKQQNAVIEDQLQEIEYLSKQTAALREVNDSRLRIYEQLEISIQELEKNNQRLSAESASDKKKIRNLCSTLESLEARCDELQRNLEEARSGAQQQTRGRNKRRSIILDEQNLRRSHSCENTPQNSEDRAAEDLEMRSRLEEIQQKMKLLQKEKESEIRKKDELEIQLACMSQENAVLHDQLLILREKEVTLRSFDEELASLDDTSSGRLCRKCLGNVDETASNPTIYDLQDSIEDTDVSIESTHGECALVRLKNGGYAWGSQESLASIGQVMSRMGSEGTSPGTEASDAPHNSLLSELDTSYRILIEKYEALLEAREQQQQQHQQQQNSSRPDEGLVHPGVDDLSGPMSLVMTDALHDASRMALASCQRCHTCTCDAMKASVGRPKSTLEEFSEVETSSSGFSDGESRLSNKSTQTGADEVLAAIQRDFVLEDLTPTVPSRCLDLSSPLNPCDKRFQAAPEYKKLFQEIFTVLKQTVDEKDTKGQPQQQQQQQVKPSKAVEGEKAPKKAEVEPESSSDETRVSPLKEEKAEVFPVVPVATPDLASSEDKENRDINAQRVVPDVPREERTPSILDDQKVPEGQRVTHKPPRPDSLDLGGSGSRPTSRQKRRSRYRTRLDSYQPQQQPQQHSGQHSYSSHSHERSDSQNSSHQHRQQHRREREHSQTHHHHRHYDRNEADNDHSKTRIIYNSSRARCEHHRSRRSRGRSNNRQRHGQEQPNNSTSSSSNQQQQQNSESESRGRPTAPKINYPSIEVAKLRKLEMSYAEALKSSFSRSHYNHRRY